MNYLRNFCIASFLLLISLNLNGQREISYIKGGISDAKSMAISEGKLYMAVFYTDWCLPCKWMDENTFSSVDVVNFVEDHYVAVKVNIDDFDGHNARQQFNVEFLPTILVFDQGGDIIARYEESLSAKKLLEGLEKHRFDLENRRIRLSSTPPPAVRLSDRPSQETSAQPSDKKEIGRESQQPRATTRPQTPPEQPSKPLPKSEPDQSTVNQPVQKQEPPKPVEKKDPPMPVERKESAQQVENKPAEKETIVRPKTTSPSPRLDRSNYYSVQVGTFSRFENADRLRDEYREIFGEGVHIKIEVEGAQTIYKVMIGRYANYEDAEPLMTLLKEQGIEGFIKSVSME